MCLFVYSLRKYLLTIPCARHGVEHTEATATDTGLALEGNGESDR